MAEKKKLGRGLSALLGDTNEDFARLDRVRTAKPVAIELLHPGKYQPRHHVDQAAIESLAQSIREKGVLQPLLVRRHPDDANAFEIIAGERRWRAAQLAHLHEVPVIIKDFDDKTTLEVALIENVQREDLSAIEEADAYQRLIDEFGHNQEDVARLVGRSRSHVANTLRLLSLDSSVKKLIEQGLLSAGHARTLIGAQGAYEKAKLIVEKNLSVREAERLARQTQSKTSGTTATKSRQKDVDTIALERDLSNLLGLAVQIDGSGAKGTLRIGYETLDQLDLLIAKLRGDRISAPPQDETPDASMNAESTSDKKPAETPKLSVSLKPKTVISN